MSNVYKFFENLNKKHFFGVSIPIVSSLYFFHKKENNKESFSVDKCYEESLSRELIRGLTNKYLSETGKHNYQKPLIGSYAIITIMNNMEERIKQEDDLGLKNYINEKINQFELRRRVGQIEVTDPLEKIYLKYFSVKHEFSENTTTRKNI